MPKSNLNSQSQYLWIIFGRANSPLVKEFKYYYDILTEWCKINARLWCFIGHDKDIDENGNAKFRHIHALIILKEGLKPRLSTTLNRLANALNINTVDIDIEIADSIPSCVRYCLHKGYPDKYQYPVEDLQTNLTTDDLKPYLDIEEKSFTAAYLIQLITICNCSVITIAKQIGLKNYLKYRNLIIDVIKELSA